MSATRTRRIGLIGGTSWESTLEYYRLINRGTGAALGGNHTAEILLWSFDFGEILDAVARGDGHLAAARFREAAIALAGLGAELLVICSNTGHQRAEDIAATVAVPIVHIADAVGAALRQRGLARIGLLGTLSTMQGTFYRERLQRLWGIETVVPPPEIQQRVHEIALVEVARGVRSEASRNELAAIVNGLCTEGVVLGCTELPLLLSSQDVDVPIFDSLSLHVDAIVGRALQ